jgi:dTDP-4-dehydrorhamnose reductase
MKILVTGTNGQVGHALMRELTDHELISLTRKDCDLTNPDQIRQLIDQYQPDLIINPAAYTQVDQAEDEPELAFEINRDAPRVMAEKAREYTIPFIHFSTDYVFDGQKEGAYTEEDLPNPLGIYGQSKLAGEEAIKEVDGHYYIFRTSWVYSGMGHNFYLNIQQKIGEQDELKVVNDQLGVPTSSLFIAQQIKKMIPKLLNENRGIYHLVPNGACTWFDFAKVILNTSKPDQSEKKIIPVSSDLYPTKAKRPRNSCLANDKIQKAFVLEFDDWKSVFLESLKNINE